MNINENNIELYLFRYKEGLLEAAEAAEVERALASHTDWQELADLYDPNLKLPAGATMSYQDIESLRDGGPKAHRAAAPIKLRDNDTPRRRLMPFWTTVAAAACLLLFVTTVLKFVGGGVQSGGPVVAELDIDSNEVQPVVENGVEDIVLPKATNGVQSRRPRTQEPVMLAENTPQPQVNAAAETNEQAVSQQQATPSESRDTNLYQLDDPTLREINDPMDQTVMYASDIIVRQEASGNEPSSSRREQLRNLARRATSIAASHQKRRGAIEESIEDQIENNEFISNLIATLE